MTRIHPTLHLGVCFALAALAVGGAGCRKHPKPKAQAALNLQVVANADVPATNIELVLRAANNVANNVANNAANKEPLRSVVELHDKAPTLLPSDSKGEDARRKNKTLQALSLKRASTLFRVAPGAYAIELRAFDPRGALIPGCRALLTGQDKTLRATQGQLQQALVLLECDEAASPLAQLNRTPQQLRVHMPKHQSGQQGSFARDGEASFCLSAWDPDQNALRFEVKDQAATGCIIHADKAQLPAARGAEQKRCYQVKCKPDFVGRLDLHARVFDQVWRAGSKMDIPGQGTKDRAGLSFALKFVQGHS